MPVPDIKADEHKLKVVHVGSRNSTTVKEFSLKDLSKFRPATLNAALMCAGNRRSEMNQVSPS